jgi:hypothetical protein
MTTISKIGDSDNIGRDRKPIGIVFELGSDKLFEESDIIPADWDNIVLISKDYTNDGFDLIFIYGPYPADGFLCLGHWNDGIV